MSKHCCIPCCESKRPLNTLYHVPAKRFVKAEKLEWADNMEKVILGLRGDKGITSLYKRDQVHICGKHFHPHEIITSKWLNKPVN